MTFGDAPSVLAYLPYLGFPAQLTGSVLDPVTTASGTFGGNLIALELNVDFSDAGFLLPAASGLRFGDLILENFTTLPAINGLTVRQFLPDENICLGGGSCLYSPADSDSTLLDLNGSFFYGTPSTFAQDYLAAPVSSVPEPSSLLMLFPVMAALVWHRRGRRN